MMMFHQQSPHDYPLPATEALALSLRCLDARESGKTTDNTRNKNVLAPSHHHHARFYDSRLAESCDFGSSPMIGVQLPPNFALEEISKATRLIEDSLDFPVVQWAFEDRAYYVRNMTTHSSLAKRRRSRGLVRSMSSSDLSEMIESHDD